MRYDDEKVCLMNTNTWDELHDVMLGLLSLHSLQIGLILCCKTCFALKFALGIPLDVYATRIKYRISSKEFFEWISVLRPAYLLLARLVPFVFTLGRLRRWRPCYTKSEGLDIETAAGRLHINLGKAIRRTKSAADSALFLLFRQQMLQMSAHHTNLLRLACRCQYHRARC